MSLEKIDKFVRGLPELKGFKITTPSTSNGYYQIKLSKGAISDTFMFPRSATESLIKSITKDSLMNFK